MAECEGRGELRRQIEAIEVIAARLDEDIDFLVWDLSPAVLDDLGLHAALASYVRNWSTHFGISAELQARGFEGDRLRPEIETTLYRIAQEALTNIAKHARAARADVILEARRSRLAHRRGRWRGIRYSRDGRARPRSVGAGRI